MGVRCSKGQAVAMAHDEVSQLLDAENLLRNTRSLGGFGAPISEISGDLALASDQSGYSDVRIRIHDTFPMDVAKYGTVYIQINKPESSAKKEEGDSATPGFDSNIILCGGRPHTDVSAELRKRLDIDAIGFTVVFVPPPIKNGGVSRSWGKKTMANPHFVGFHKHHGKVHIAWASTITGLHPQSIPDVPVVWKTSEDVSLDTDGKSGWGDGYDLPTFTTEKRDRPAKAGGMQLVDIRPCYAHYTFWFKGCRATVSPMVEVTRYDAQMLYNTAGDAEATKSMINDAVRRKRVAETARMTRRQSREEIDLVDVRMRKPIDVEFRDVPCLPGDESPTATRPPLFSENDIDIVNEGLVERQVEAEDVTDYEDYEDFISEEDLGMWRSRDNIGSMDEDELLGSETSAVLSDLLNYAAYDDDEDLGRGVDADDGKGVGVYDDIDIDEVEDKKVSAEDQSLSELSLKTQETEARLSRASRDIQLETGESAYLGAGSPKGKSRKKKRNGRNPRDQRMKIPSRLFMGSPRSSSTDPSKTRGKMRILTMPSGRKKSRVSVQTGFLPPSSPRTRSKNSSLSECSNTHQRHHSRSFSMSAQRHKTSDVEEEYDS